MVRANIREAYEQGIRDSKRGVFEEAISDAVDTANEEMGMGYDQDELAAYYKGRNGEQLDEERTTTMTIIKTLLTWPSHLLE